MPTKRCPAETPAPTTPRQEPHDDEEANAPPGPMNYNDAVATWQALFEWSTSDGLEAESLPVIPQHVVDNVVETMVDKRIADHNTLVDVLPSFLAMIQQDIYMATSRARALRERLSGAGSSTDPSCDKPPAAEPEEEDDDHLYMQTTLEFRKPHQGHETVLSCLQRAFNDLAPERAASRAIRLAARLQDYDGHLVEDRQSIEALLVTFANDIPPKPEGDECLLEWSWVGTWWRRLTGQPEHDPDEIDANLHAYQQALDSEAAIREAEEANEAAAEQQYLQHLAEAAENHMEQAKAEACREEDEETMRAAMGLSWKPPAKRLCIGTCITDGRTTKAWDWELDRGAEVQIHVKATKKDYPGQWYKGGKPLPDDAVPELVKTGACKDPATVVMPRTFDLRQPATRELFRRWQDGKVSNQSVVTASSTDMLAFFQSVKRITPDELARMDMHASAQNNTSGSSTDLAPPVLPSLVTHPGPTTMPSTASTCHVRLRRPRPLLHAMGCRVLY